VKLAVEEEMVGGAPAGVVERAVWLVEGKNSGWAVLLLLGVVRWRSGVEGRSGELGLGFDGLVVVVVSNWKRRDIFFWVFSFSVLLVASVFFPICPRLFLLREFKSRKLGERNRRCGRLGFGSNARQLGLRVAVGQA
jgi:hypothetical protein